MRYFLDRDESCHWYIVPEPRRADWEAFLALPAEDERSWEVPEWVTPLQGSPSRLTFTNPKQ